MITKSTSDIIKPMEEDNTKILTSETNALVNGDFTKGSQCPPFIIPLQHEIDGITINQNGIAVTPYCCVTNGGLGVRNELFKTSRDQFDVENLKQQQKKTSCHCVTTKKTKSLFRMGLERFIPKSLKRATTTLCYYCSSEISASKISNENKNRGENVLENMEGKSGSKEKLEQRGHWAGNSDFLMSLIAYAVGLGNVWRFPYLCFKNGGGAFLVPYFSCWLLAAVPVFFMEVSIGQFLGEGGISVWKLCPIFRGIGIANTLIAIFCNIYFPVIVAWATFYVISTFTTSGLPWQTCERSWNNEFCFDSHVTKNYSNWTAITGLNFSESQSPVTQFWEKRVLKTTQSIEETGGIQWELLGLLAFIWVLTYFALWKGITNSRKLVYACAITPYILLVILLIRGLTLDGAWDGVKFYLKPNLSMLLKAEVWKDAGTQIFYSTGIGFGTLVALGSYNKYNHNVFKDAVTLCLVNSMTSLMAGFVVFSVLGYMAQEAGKSIDQVVKSGVGLAFLVYPEAISTMPISKLWSLLFFLMIMILGLDSLVCMVEGVVLAISDQFPQTLRQHKKLFLAALCCAGFLCGVPMICQSGQFWLTLVDSYGASGISLLFVVFFEIIALSWVFGTKNIYRALEDMLQYRPSKFWHYSWRYSAPVVCILILGITIYDYTPIMYPDNQTPYPFWAMITGFIISSTSILSIPIYALYYILREPGPLKQRFINGIRPCITLKFEKTLQLSTVIPMKNGHKKEEAVEKERGKVYLD